MRRLLLLAFPSVLLIAGCGPSSSGGPSSSSTDGKSLFAAKCGACHTLKAAGTSGTFGPNLDDLKPGKGLVLNTIKTGPGPMPAGLYQGKQAGAVAAFVSSTAGK
jgi:mono/diheme cytochrome c family protein